MIELSKERIEQILHEETAKKEELDTILRGIYTRYMRLFEEYFADIGALNDDKIAELKNYHGETGSLLKYYYMDIPLDICLELKEFDDRYSANLLGTEWHKYLFDLYGEFREKNSSTDKNEDSLRADFSKQTLKAFYETMDYIFREGFGTGSRTLEKAANGIAGLLFGKE